MNIVPHKKLFFIPEYGWMIFYRDTGKPYLSSGSFPVLYKTWNRALSMFIYDPTIAFSEDSRRKFIVKRVSVSMTIQPR